MVKYLKCISTFSGLMLASLSSYSLSPPNPPPFVSLDKSTIQCVSDTPSSTYSRLTGDEVMLEHRSSDLAALTTSALWFRGGETLKTIGLTNEGFGDVVVESITGTPGYFSIDTPLPQKVSPGDILELEFSYSPSEGLPQNPSGIATINYRDGGSRSLLLWGENTAIRQTLNLSSCQVLDQANTIYILQNDISSATTCLTVAAKNISIDLNGYKISYGSSGTDWAHGVVASASWAPNAQPGFSGPQSEGLEIYNGTIEQAGYETESIAAGKYGHGIHLNQQNGGSSVEIRDLTINVYRHSAQNIRANHRKHLYIHNNRLNSKVKTIENRHAFDGSHIYIGGSSEMNHIHSNILEGGPQAGIFSSGHYSHIHNNSISQSSSYTNDFSIRTSGARSQVYSNTISPNPGRGILLEGNNILVFENNVNVTSAANNEEYNGCQPGGTFGIQIEEGAHDSFVFRNNITARASDCAAAGLRATNVEEDANNIVFGNTVTATKLDSVKSGRAQAISLAAVKGGITFYRNDLSTNNIGIELSYSGSKNINFIQDDLKLNSPAINPYVLSFRNNAPATGLYFEDINLRDFDWEMVESYKANDAWHGSYSYTIGTGVEVSLGLSSDDYSLDKIVRYGEVVYPVGVSAIAIPLERVYNSSSSAEEHEYISTGALTVSRSSFAHRILINRNELEKSYHCLVSEKSP